MYLHMYIKSTIPVYLYYAYVYYISKSVPCFTQLISQPRHLVLAATPVTHYCRAGTFHPCTRNVVQPHLPAHPPSPQPEAMAKVPVSSVLWVQGLWAGEAASPRARGGIRAKCPTCGVQCPGISMSQGSAAAPGRSWNSISFIHPRVTPSLPDGRATRPIPGSNEKNIK